MQIFISKVYGKNSTLVFVSAHVNLRFNLVIQFNIIYLLSSLTRVSQLIALINFQETFQNNSNNNNPFLLLDRLRHSIIAVTININLTYLRGSLEFYQLKNLTNIYIQ